MPFLTLNNADIWFIEWEFVWRTYNTAKALPTTQKVEIINKKEFATAVLNNDNKSFVVYMAAYSMGSTVYLSQQTQITLLDVKKVIIPAKYLEYIDVFFPDSATKLLEHININNHPINLIDDI